MANDAKRDDVRKQFRIESIRRCCCTKYFKTPKKKPREKESEMFFCPTTDGRLMYGEP